MTVFAAHMVRPLSLPLVVHIVNEWGGVPRTAAHGGRRPYPDPANLVTEYPELEDRLPAPDESSLIETADLIHPIFAATTGEQCAQRLNDVMALTRMTSELTANDWSIQEDWSAAAPGRGLLASAALTLLEHLRTDPDSSRLGTCSGHACLDAYVDQSPAGRRRYCSLTCQNRNRTRAYRASRQATKAAEAQDRPRDSSSRT